MSKTNVGHMSIFARPVKQPQMGSQAVLLVGGDLGAPYIATALALVDYGLSHGLQSVAFLQEVVGPLLKDCVSPQRSLFSHETPTSWLMGHGRGPLLMEQLVKMLREKTLDHILANPTRYYLLFKKAPLVIDESSPLLLAAIAEVIGVPCSVHLTEPEKNLFLAIDYKPMTTLHGVGAFKIAIQVNAAQYTVSALSHTHRLMTLLPAAQAIVLPQRLLSVEDEARFALADETLKNSYQTHVKALSQAILLDHPHMTTEALHALYCGSFTVEPSATVVLGLENGSASLRARFDTTLEEVSEKLRTLAPDICALAMRLAVGCVNESDVYEKLRQSTRAFRV